MIVQKRREKDIIQELVVKNDPCGQFSDSGEVNAGEASGITLTSCH